MVYEQGIHLRTIPIWSNVFLRNKKKAVLDKIVNNCLNLGDFKECIKKYQNIRKSFKKEIHEYFE